MIRTPLPQLSMPQARVFALWSLGMVLARSCVLTAVAVFLAAWLHRKEQTVRQQLQELCDEAEGKRATTRQALAVAPCFAPLLRWVLSGWQGTRLAMALDATTLGLRFTVLAISVVYRGCAIPVAWTILLANHPETWQRHWLWLLRVGGATEETILASTLLDVSAPLVSHRRQQRATRRRLVSLVRRGWITVLAALLNQAPLPLGAFLPETWPGVPALDTNSVGPDAEVYHHVAA